MQQSPLTLRQRLIDAVDETYHVKDMGAIIEVLGTLERLPVTKELLETTRLGKTINEFRKRINDEKLAKRSKALVKKWRDAVLTTNPSPSLIRPVNGTSDGSHLTPQLSNVGPLRNSTNHTTGYSSNSSSPKLNSTNTSKVSPSSIHNSNSNSLSPRILSNLNSNNNNNNNNNITISTTTTTTITTILENETIPSASDLGAISIADNDQPQQPQVVSPSEVQQQQPPIKRGRKKKVSALLDAETRIHQQIAQAQQENKIRTVHRLSMEVFDDEHSRPPTDFGAGQLELVVRKQLNSQSTSTTTTPALITREEDPALKSEIVEKYLQSQNELRTKMERQYQDAVKNNEIPLTPDSQPSPPPGLHHPVENDVMPGDELDNKRKRKRDKKKNRENSDTTTYYFPSESEILSRLPPIDPQILAELKNFQFYVPSESPEDAKSKSELLETENSTSLTTTTTTNETVTSQVINKIIVTPKESIITSKIDWGDSDDEFMEVSSPNIETTTASAVTAPSRDEVDSEFLSLQHHPQSTFCDPTYFSTTPQDSIPNMLINNDVNMMDLDEVEQKQEPQDMDHQDIPPTVKLIEESDVDRLHLEKVENLNGNLDKDGQFREWQEVLPVESFKGDTLHILPYTIIDF